jgi:hypothetical protein
VKGQIGELAKSVTREGGMAASRTAAGRGGGGVEMGQPDSRARSSEAGPDVPPHATLLAARSNAGVFVAVGQGGPRPRGRAALFLDMRSP